MTQSSWWVVQQLSRFLEPDERDAALGDFAETRAPIGTALLDVAGLIVRRQIAVWAEWRPWFALLGIVVPISVLLLHFCLTTVRTFHLYFWIIGNYQHFDLQMLEGTRFTLEHGLAVMLRHACLLSLWSWTGGFVLASLSRHAIWMNLVFLCCTGGLVVATTLGLPSAPKATVMLSVVAVFIAFPLIWGVQQGLRRGALEKRTAALLAAAVVFATAYASWAGGWWQGGTQHAIKLSLAVVMGWPAAYIVTTAANQPNRANLAGQ